MIIQTKRSANAEWMNVILNHEPHEFPAVTLGIVDNSGDDLPKRLLVFMANQAEESPLFNWYDIHILANGRGRFKFSGQETISGVQNAHQISSIPVVAGRSYSVVDYAFVDSGVSNNRTEYDIVNNDNSHDLDLTVSRNGFAINAVAIGSNSTYSIQFRPTFYTYATNNIDAPPNGSLANTEISVLGLKYADIQIGTPSESVYPISLINVVYA